MVIISIPSALVSISQDISSKGDGDN
uniref:Uncharacterized protein n=1 Tax=Rhizophora mucronata TaxID=61149 RepID=A0A2P2J0Q1_RHIMU